MKLVVFGANGPTGRILCRLALEEGNEIVAFTRKPDSFPIDHSSLQIVGGDVHDAAAVAAAIVDTDAVGPRCCTSRSAIASASSPSTVSGWPPWLC